MVVRRCTDIGRQAERECFGDRQTTVAIIDGLNIKTLVKNVVDTAFHQKGIRDRTDRRVIIRRRRSTVRLIHICEATIQCTYKEGSLDRSDRERRELRDQIRASVAPEVTTKRIDSTKAMRAIRLTKDITG